MLKIKNFTKVYSNGKKAVDNISLHVEKGDIYGFIGHNGAGKTSTIKCIVGIQDYTEGSILIDGLEVSKNSIETKKISAYVPDNPDLYDSLTAIQFINFVSDLHDVSQETRKTLTEKYAKIFELENDLNMYISQFSHGMKQKLAIICALVHNPKLLILDEPFVGLDPKSSFIFKEMMKEFCENGGAIFFSTHVLEVAEKICNKVAIIKQGKIIKSGNMEDIIKDNSLEQVFMEQVSND